MLLLIWDANVWHECNLSSSYKIPPPYVTFRPGPSQHEIASYQMRLNVIEMSTITASQIFNQAWKYSFWLFKIELMLLSVSLSPTSMLNNVQVVMCKHYKYVKIAADSSGYCRRKSWLKLSNYAGDLCGDYT